MTTRASGLAVFTAAPAIAPFRVPRGAALGSVDAPFAWTFQAVASLSTASTPACVGALGPVPVALAVLARSARRAAAR